ncbi:MAG TPA: hypothetical protein VN763_13565, partial [Saprospiraceae bacterium]|nr:hypothetical protein [Saprospiraceae bacterium]
AIEMAKKKKQPKIISLSSLAENAWNYHLRLSPNPDMFRDVEEIKKWTLILRSKKSIHPQIFAKFPRIARDSKGQQYMPVWAHL